MNLIPRMAKFVTPKSLNPKDVIKAASQTEKDMVSALIKEPMASVGIKLPDLPTPMGIASMAANQLPEVSGFPALNTFIEQRGGKGAHNPWPPRTISVTAERQDLIEEGVAPPAEEPPIRYAL